MKPPANRTNAPSRKDERRALYRDDPATSNAAKQASRDHYREKTGARPPARLANGLITVGETREVIAG